MNNNNVSIIHQLLDFLQKLLGIVVWWECWAPSSREIPSPWHRRFPGEEERCLYQFQPYALISKHQTKVYFPSSYTNLTDILQSPLQHNRLHQNCCGLACCKEEMPAVCFPITLSRKNAKATGPYGVFCDHTHTHFLALSFIHFPFVILT